MDDRPNGHGLDFHMQPESFSVGQQLAHTLLHPDLAGILIFSDGLRVNGSELVPWHECAVAGLGHRDRGLGVMATVFSIPGSCGSHPQEGLISAVGLYGDRVRLDMGRKAGGIFFGPGTPGHQIQRQCAL